MNDFAKHMKALDDINYDLDFRDLYHFHQDIWITMDHANYLPLTEMSKPHIVNVITFINNKGITVAYGLGKLWLPKLKKELKRREGN